MMETLARYQASSQMIENLRLRLYTVQGKMGSQPGVEPVEVFAMIGSGSQEIFALLSIAVNQSQGSEVVIT